MAQFGLGQRLKASREAKGLTLEFVGTEVDRNARSVARWEDGETEPSIEQLVQLAELYGVTTEYLIHGDAVCSS